MDKYSPVLYMHFSFSYDFLNKMFFSLASVILRILCITRIPHKISAHCLFVGSVRLRVNGRSLVVKISGCQKLHTHIWLGKGVSEPITPHVVQGTTVFDFLRWLQEFGVEENEGVGTNSPWSTMTKRSVGTKTKTRERDRTGLEDRIMVGNRPKCLPCVTEFSQKSLVELLKMVQKQTGGQS